MYPMVSSRKRHLAGMLACAFCGLIVSEGLLGATDCEMFSSNYLSKACTPWKRGILAVSRSPDGQSAMIRLATSRKIGLLVAFFSAYSIQADAAIRLQSIANGLASPLYVTSAGDSSGRLFIVEQAGRIRIFSGSALVSI